jgi:hypothetical protein
MAKETLVIYNGEKDLSNKQWSKIKKGEAYLAEDIDDRNYRVYLTGTDYPSFCSCYDFPKMFFYNFQQYLPLIPKSVFDREANERERELSKLFRKEIQEMTIAIYNGIRN